MELHLDKVFILLGKQSNLKNKIFIELIFNNLRDASYSDKYSKLHNSLIYGGNNLHYMNSKYMNSNNSKSFSMILSKVIVGMYHKGTADMKDSPMRDETLQYDSTVDCVNNPSIFVIYKDYRAYPNYIIHYT